MTYSPTTPCPGFSESIILGSPGYLVSRVESLMSNTVTRRTMSELGVTDQQGRILLLVATRKCCTASEVARESGVHASAVTRLIRRLQDRDLLVGVRSSQDRRVIKLALSPRGRFIVESFPVVVDAALERLLSGLTQEEIGFFKGMLRRIIVNSGRIEVEYRSLRPAGSRVRNSRRETAETKTRVTGA
ncbi:MarR family transcriptional regulator [Paraburkholderia xenovorans]|uniref:MarR family winged helix-turn-helix transcriptional regulator n=1 Tax=Paraburkholderia xenovorans TaxID=36873 RepID=UPI0038B71275